MCPLAIDKRLGQWMASGYRLETKVVEVFTGSLGWGGGDFGGYRAVAEAGEHFK